MLPSNYIDILRSGIAPKPQPFVSGICGRMIRGTKPSDFETLTDDPSRLVVMLMDSDGLAKLFGKSGYQILIEIGYRGDYIKQKLDAGNQFKLVVFPQEAAHPATWKGVTDVACSVYPELTSCFTKHGAGLQSGSLWGGKCFMHEFEKLAGYKFCDADKKADPRFMNIEAYRKSTKTAWELRAFLYHTLHLRELFSGDGFTYNEQGKRQLKEYLMLNKKIADIKDAAVLDIAVTIP